MRIDFNTWMSLVLLVVILLLLIRTINSGLTIHATNKTTKSYGIHQKWMMLCRCGHPKSSHDGSSGPYSSGQYHHGECTDGSKSFPPYRISGCDCYVYKRLFFPRYRRHHGRI